MWRDLIPLMREHPAARIGAALSALVLCAGALAAVGPSAGDAARLFAAQDDPARLSDLQLDPAMKRDPALLARGIADALAAGDVDLADSFADIATARGVPLSPDLTERLDTARAQSQSAASVAGRFATGFATGEGDDLASLSGTVAGDLTVYGDLRDLVREGKHLVMGEEADPLLLGLASVGLAITAGTYISLGAAAPLRTGLTVFKGARRAGNVGTGLATWASRSAREVVDLSQLQKGLATASLARPTEAVGLFKAAFRAEKAGGLVRVAKDVGRIGEKAGIRGAADAMKIADGPADVARAARLAEKKGGQTRALLKMFGRGALLLAAGAFNMAMWILWALLFLLGFVSSVRATTERLTMAWLRRRRRKRLAREVQDAPLASIAV